MLNEPSQVPFDSVLELGTLIKRGGLAPENHTGLLYKLGDHPARSVHLEWHHKLTDEEPTADWYWVQCGLDQINRRVIAPAVAEVAAEKQLPYSTNYDGIYFEGAQLRYVRTNPGEGLTCATFVLAVFEALGFPVVDKKSWSARDADQAHLAALLNFLERSAGQEHVAAIKSNSTGVRYRPEEVVGASSESAWPISFEQAVRLGEQVLAEMVRIENDQRATAEVTPAPAEGTPAAGTE